MLYACIRKLMHTGTEFILVQYKSHWKFPMLICKNAFLFLNRETTYLNRIISTEFVRTTKSLPYVEKYNKCVYCLIIFTAAAGAV